YSLDGARRWVTRVPTPVLAYGPSASPVLIGDKLLVDSTQLTALEASTGKELWKADWSDPHYGTPAILSLGCTPVAVTAKGAVIRVSDGAVLARNIVSGAGGDQSPSPIVKDDVVYFTYRLCSAVKLSMSGGEVRAEKLWERELPGDVISSPVLEGD